MVSKEKMIEWLIDSDINDWSSQKDQDEYLTHILTHGFVGYANQTYEELKEECENRDMWDILIEQEENANV